MQGVVDNSSDVIIGWPGKDHFAHVFVTFFRSACNGTLLLN